jgi:hypothetical protein
MNMTLSCIINGSFLIFALVTRLFSCSPGDSLPYDLGINPGPPKAVVTVSGTVAFPDGTTIESAVVSASTYDNSQNQTYTDAEGRYRLDGVWEGGGVRAWRHKEPALWGLDGSQLVSRTNKQINFILLRESATLIQSEDREDLSLRRYQLQDLHFGWVAWNNLIVVTFSSPNTISTDSLDSWTVYKIPPGVPWSDVTIASLESSGTATIRVKQNTVRNWYELRAGDYPHGYPFLVPLTFFLDCNNGIAFATKLPCLRYDARFEKW